MSHFSKYEKNYINLPFEDILRNYRIKKLCEFINSSPHQNILDIGCGNEPVYSFFGDFHKVTVIEPGKVFYQNALRLASNRNELTVINDVIENVSDRFEIGTFDFIILGGFLHEIPNPGEVLASIQALCSTTTLVYTYVPNAKSFHRLLAYEMGIIESIYQKSDHDKLFNRQHNFDMSSFTGLLADNGFQTVDKGSYFIKPFAHHQMVELIKTNSLGDIFFDGLDKMTKYLPEFGSEIYSLCKVKDCASSK